jgi:dUTP pyrophosphatase
LPKYQSEGAGAFDISAILDNGDLNRVESGKSVLFKTGLAFEVPKDHVMLAFSRSSMGFNHDLRLSNCVGVIDSDYRGELKVKLAYDGMYGTGYSVSPDERIVQCIVIEAKQVEFELVDDLSTTERGENGFGSTGKL